MVLDVRRISKNFQTEEGPLPVLRDLSFSVRAGETVALTGESGSGKSTLLHLVAGLDAPDGGEITIAGQPVSGLDDSGRAALRRTTVGLVFQQFNLVPSLTVGANLSLHARLGNKQDTAWEAELAARLGLSALLNRYPEQLSGGQQQRVAIGRTLAARPSLVLADEPTGNLDQQTGDAVMDLMLDLVAETGAGFLMVTHSERLAARMGRRLHLAQGRLS